MRGFENLGPYFSKKEFQLKLVNYFNLHWCIDETISPSTPVASLKNGKTGENLDVRSVDFQDEMSSVLDDEDLFFSIKDDK